MKTDYKKLIQEQVNHLFDCMKDRLNEEDQRKLKEAYQFAYEAHKGQLRKSGEPYICHPVAVATIVAEEMRLGVIPVMAALLHDVVEDTPCTIETIRRFGVDVAYLVGVLTKPHKAIYATSKQVDNYQQILASVHCDPLAIMLKLADRLHNMRTLASMRPDKQMKIAGETDYFYAPLANRLGLYQIKTELENLSFKYRCPREYNQLQQMIARNQEVEKADLLAFADQIDALLAANGIKARVELRYRMPYSVWRKMRAKNCDAQHVEGKHYFCIIYPAADRKEEKQRYLQIYAALTDTTFKESPGSVVNYINSPKENGYQSFHVKLLNERTGWEEIHISSERMVTNSQLGCAAEGAEGNLKAWLEKFKGFLKDIAAQSNNGYTYMDDVTCSFYNDDIFVFTPKGQFIMLPKGSTALDLAFEIHSEVGLHALFARVNDRLVSVKTILHRGDRVEIGIADNTVPDRSWFAHVHTYKAKRALRSCFSRQPKLLPYDRCPCCTPLPGDEVIGFREKPDGIITLHRCDCGEAIRLASEHGDSIVAVTFEEQESLLYPVRIHIRGVDRHHLLKDLVACITEQQNLSITRFNTVTTDAIVDTTVDFAVHSLNELDNAMRSIAHIDYVDEVSRMVIKEEI